MMRRRINRKRLGWQLLAVSLVLGAASVPYSVAAQETKASSSEDSEESESKEEYEYRIEDGKAIISSYLGEEEQVSIPEYLDGALVTRIESGAFYGKRSIKTLYIPENIQEIDEFAFQGCVNMTSLTIEGNPIIKDKAFKYCGSLTEINLSDDIDKLGIGVFEGCIALEYVELPRQLKAVPADCFKDCTALCVAIVKDHVASIGREAFSGCTKLIGMDFPISMVKIEDMAFFNCTNMENVFIPANVTQIDGNVFRDCKKALILGEPGSEAAYFAKHSNISFQERDMASNGLEELGKGLWLYRKDGATDWNYSGLSEVGDSIYYVKNGTFPGALADLYNMRTNGIM